MTDPNFITKNFRYSEFDAEHAPADVKANLHNLCTAVLQPLRDALGRSMIVTSGYRPGDSDSDHRNGKAADVKVAGMSSRELAAFVEDVRHSIDTIGGDDAPWYDQLIWYDSTDAHPDTHVHLGWRGAQNRGMLLHAIRPAAGKTHYERTKP